MPIRECVAPCSKIRTPLLQVWIPCGPICPWLKLMFNACKAAEDLQTMAKMHAKNCEYCRGRKAA